MSETGTLERSTTAKQQQQQKQQTFVRKLNYCGMETRGTDILSRWNMEHHSDFFIRLHAISFIIVWRSDKP